MSRTPSVLERVRRVHARRMAATAREMAATAELIAVTADHLSTSTTDPSGERAARLHSLFLTERQEAQRLWALADRLQDREPS